MKKVIWLDDSEALTSTVDPIRKRTGHEPVLCLNVDEFKNVCEAHAEEPDEIAGFIVDALLPIKDLASLGLAEITTDGGHEAGVRIVEHYLLNVDELPPAQAVSAAFAGKPILVFSTSLGVESVFGALRDVPGANVSFETKGSEPHVQVQTWINTIAVGSAS